MKDEDSLRVVVKRLVAVDLPDRGSHQHELNAPADLREAFEGRPRRASISWVLFGDSAEPIRGEGEFNLYDARAKSAARTGRSEWRLYYTGDFLASAQPGDILFLALMPDGSVRGIVTGLGSAFMRAAAAALPLPAHDRFELLGGHALEGARSDVLARLVLEELEIEPPAPPSPPDVEDLALQLVEYAGREHRDFPTTAQMAEMARHKLPVDASKPDEMLVAWLRREEALFGAVERLLLSERISQGFKSVDEFAATALSVLNRRKSRMGHSLQHHLGEVFKRSGIKFAAQALTEDRNQPDFLFPGHGEYHDREFDEARLTMLAAKSTCKDRWRQILTEAERVPIKHLCTLDPAISLPQMKEMASRGVVLVIPEPLQRPYRGLEGAPGILTIKEFLEIVRSRAG